MGFEGRFYGNPLLLAWLFRCWIPPILLTQYLSVAGKQPCRVDVVVPHEVGESCGMEDVLGVVLP